MHIVLVHYLETKVTLISALLFVVLSMALFLRRFLFHCLVCRAKCFGSIFLTHVLFFPVALLNDKSTDIYFYTVSSMSKYTCQNIPYFRRSL
jgi:hypothetical protein